MHIHNCRSMSCLKNQNTKSLLIIAKKTRAFKLEGSDSQTIPVKRRVDGVAFNFLPTFQLAALVIFKTII